MAKELAIAVIHGMGSQESGFAGPMIEEIDGRVRRRGKDPAKIAWKPIFWDDIVGARQTKYLSDVRRENKLDFIGLRRFVVSALRACTRNCQVVNIPLCIICGVDDTGDFF